MTDNTEADGAGQVGDWALDVVRKFDQYGRRIEKVEDRIVQHSLRIESLEDNSGKVSMLVTTITALADRVKEMADNVDGTAERAVEKVLSRRSIERREARHQRWNHRAQAMQIGTSVLFAAAGFLSAHFHLF